jgi:hypothetical protein
MLSLPMRDGDDTYLEKEQTPMMQQPGFNPRLSAADEVLLQRLLNRLERQSQGYASPFAQEISGAVAAKAQVPGRSPMILGLKIPEAPYSAEAFERLHKTFDVIEAVEATVTIFKIPVAALLGVAAEGLLTVIAPIAGLLGVFMSLGVGYAQARADVAKQRVKIGFAKGVVTGADLRKWPYVKSVFWDRTSGEGAFDPGTTKAGREAHNLGLVSGFVQGQKLSRKQREFLWKSIGRALTPGDRTYYAPPKESWGPRMWVDWYITAAGKFHQLYVKE